MQPSNKHFKIKGTYLFYNLKKEKALDYSRAFNLYILTYIKRFGSIPSILIL